MLEQHRNYSSDYYQAYRGGSYASASAVVPIVMQCVKPASVIDAGCGVGTWLRAFMDAGVTDIRGLDGSYVDRDQLLIPDAAFTPTNLETGFTLDRTYELAMSVEVAEHLTQGAAATFVESLCRAAPVVMFGAAIPHQGGDVHINEQWQDYWVDLFGRHDYVAIDCIRPLIWNNPAVAYYYAQNTLIYVRRDRLGAYPMLNATYEHQRWPIHSLVHPRKWLEAQTPRSLTLGRLVRALPYVFARAVWGAVRPVAPAWLRRRVGRIA
jgi:hypothetical protein